MSDRWPIWEMCALNGAVTDGIAAVCGAIYTQNAGCYDTRTRCVVLRSICTGPQLQPPYIYSPIRHDASFLVALPRVSKFVQGTRYIRTYYYRYVSTLSCVRSDVRSDVAMAIVGAGDRYYRYYCKMRSGVHKSIVVRCTGRYHVPGYATCNTHRPGW